MAKKKKAVKEKSKDGSRRKKKKAASPRSFFDSSTDPSATSSPAAAAGISVGGSAERDLVRRRILVLLDELPREHRFRHMYMPDGCLDSLGREDLERIEGEVQGAADALNQESAARRQAVAKLGRLLVLMPEDGATWLCLRGEGTFDEIKELNPNQIEAVANEAQAEVARLVAEEEARRQQEEERRVELMEQYNAALAELRRTDPAHEFLTAEALHPDAVVLLELEKIQHATGLVAEATRRVLQQRQDEERQRQEAAQNPQLEAPPQVAQRAPLVSGEAVRRHWPIVTAVVLVLLLITRLSSAYLSGTSPKVLTPEEIREATKDDWQKLKKEMGVEPVSVTDLKIKET